MNKPDPYLPLTAKVVERKEEAKNIFTLGLQFADKNIGEQYAYFPGQFNMLYLFGVGEIAISIQSHSENDNIFYHTIRKVGRVTHGFSLLNVGDNIGIRGPFGLGWPLVEAKNKHVLVITGGLGCAPSVSIINYIESNREDFQRLIILQGVKHSDDLIFREHYQRWANMPRTEVHLAADVGTKQWVWHTGLITELLDHISIDVNNTICMMCGPEAMLFAATKRLLHDKFPESKIYLNMERNMECALGHCGHCQFGGKFICKDGPVFCYPKIKSLLGKKGF